MHKMIVNVLINFHASFVDFGYVTVECPMTTTSVGLTQARPIKRQYKERQYKKN